MCILQRTLQVILEPIDPNERVPEEDFEKVQIDWDLKGSVITRFFVGL